MMLLEFNPGILELPKFLEISGMRVIQGGSDPEFYTRRGP